VQRQGTAGTTFYQLGVTNVGAVDCILVNPPVLHFRNVDGSDLGIAVAAGTDCPADGDAEGALGIIETSSGELDVIKDEIRKMRDLTDKPFGVNIAQMLVRDPGIVDFVHDQGVRFVTTSAGDPGEYTPALHDAGITVFHVVPTLRAPLKAVRAGVDGIVAEGGEGGGFKASRDVSTMVLLPLVCSQVEVPVVPAALNATRTDGVG